MRADGGVEGEVGDRLEGWGWGGSETIGVRGWGLWGGQAECASHLIEASERIILPVISVWAVGAAPCRGNVREKMR